MSSKKRVEYGFNLVFPFKPFTLSDLRKQKKGEISYITLRKRVEKALSLGGLTVVGQRKCEGKGRPQAEYLRVIEA